jgi:hypothetical protein
MSTKNEITEEEIQALIKIIMLGEPFPAEIKLANLNIKQIEYIKSQCYRNLGSMLTRMELLDSYLKDAIKTNIKSL